ncbi:MAG: alpha/beta hydrolase, partial [Rhodococcus sp. (in: high G+C Gram-positive bacteria)]|uniref:alpha/beta fold hydrolase n=1 Tax=Rhodococcus sp. TaxID=1831 RepID=UPI003BB0AFBD
MDPPTTRYVDRDGHALAYQVVGDRGVDIVWYLDAGLHLDLMWTDPHIHYLFERTTTFSRSVCFQRRGFGLSDRVDHVPTIEEQADDVLAVMDAVGMEKAILVGIGTACGPLALLAARTPDRVTGVFFHQPFAESLLQTDPVPHGLTPETGVTLVEGWLDAARNWGTGQTLSMWDPAADTTFNRRLMAMMERCSCTPAEARAHFDWFLRLDYSQTLPLVQCPLVAVLVADSPMPEGVVRYVAEQAPRGAFVQLPPSPPGAALGEAWRAVIDAVEELATGSHHPADADR